MNKVDLEQKQTRVLYRELFWKANEGFNEQINSIKSPFFCKKCRTCCQIRYTDLSPQEIYELALQGEEISSEYIDLFIPYGTDGTFDYKISNKIDLTVNNQAAMNANKDHVELILSKHSSPVYFYYCKHMKICNKKNPVSKSQLCLQYPNSVSSILPSECGYREWQKMAIDRIKTQISKDIYLKLQDIEKYRQTFSCKMTGTCCKLASSEFSYKELKQKAQNGDNFAKQFTSVFIPYESIEDARKIFPEFIDFAKEKLDADEEIYFYHCPHVTEDNRCSIYEQRPQICKDFPNNPLSILPPNCAFCEWKDEVSPVALLMHALVEISEFNLNKIEKALSQ